MPHNQQGPSRPPQHHRIHSPPLLHPDSPHPSSPPLLAQSSPPSTFPKTISSYIAHRSCVITTSPYLAAIFVFSSIKYLGDSHSLHTRASLISFNNKKSRPPPTSFYLPFLQYRSMHACKPPHSRPFLPFRSFAALAIERLMSEEVRRHTQTCKLARASAIGPRSNRLVCLGLLRVALDPSLAVLLRIINIIINARHASLSSSYVIGRGQARGGIGWMASKRQITIRFPPLDVV